MEQPQQTTCRVGKFGPQHDIDPLDTAMASHDSLEHQVGKLEVGMVLNEQPVQFPQNRCDVLMLTCLHATFCAVHSFYVSYKFR